MSHAPHVYGNWRGGTGTQTLTLNNRVQLAIDNQGAGGNEAELPGLWNPATNRVGGPGTTGLLAIGDLMEIRVSLIATLASLLTLSVNPQLVLDFDITATNDGLTPLVTDQKLLSINTGTQQLTYSFPVYVGATFMANGMAISVTCSVPGVSLGTTCKITKPSLVIIKHPR